MGNDNLSFGQMVRDRRRQLELTQDELAQRIRLRRRISDTSSPASGIRRIRS